MSDTQQPSPLGSGSAEADAAAELAEIQRRQERVIESAVVPVWSWWVIALALVAIGAARDSHHTVVLAISIPLAAVVIAGAIIASLPEVRRRVRVSSAAQPDGRGGVALASLILLVIAVTIALAVILTDNRVPHPLTISYGAGAAVLVIGGPLLNKYLSRLMLSNARQHMTDAPRPGAQWRGLLSSDPGDHSPGHAGRTNDGGTA